MVRRQDRVPIKERIQRAIAVVVIFGVLLLVMHLIQSRSERIRQESFEKHLKLGEATIDGLHESSGKSATITIKLSFPYKGERIEVHCGMDKHSNFIIRDNIFRFRKHKVQIAFDSLNPKEVDIILTQKEYRKYGLKQPDSLYWVEDE